MQFFECYIMGLLVNMDFIFTVAMANASHLFSYHTSLREVFFLIFIFDFPQASISSNG